MLEHSLQALLAQLQNANLTLRKRLEIAQAIVPSLNANLARLLTIEALPKMAFVGGVIRQAPYAFGGGPVDSCQVFVAAIQIPGGVGVLLIDAEDYLVASRQQEGLEREALTKFVAFADCSPVIQATLLPHIAAMLARLCRWLD
jgi:hypothetical protein